MMNWANIKINIYYLNLLFSFKSLKMKENNSTQQSQINQSQNQGAQREQNDMNRKSQQQAFDTKLMNFFAEEFSERKLEIAPK